MMAPTMPAEYGQWKRYEVFQQAREDAPFANVGSVHAPDPEIAMQNARDVFVRRPQTHSLWVAPANAILSRTAQEVEAMSWPETALPDDGVGEQDGDTFYVFRKTTQRRAMTFVTQAGEVVAPSAMAALQRAVQRFGAEGPTYVWWIVPAEAIFASRPEDAASMFEPAHDKDYRMPTQYRTQTMMRELEEHDGSA